VVDVRVPATGKTFPGRIARVADRLDSDTRTMPVEVDVRNPSMVLVPGMYAQAAIAIGQADGVLMVPVEAVDRAGAEGQLLVVTADHRVEPRRVRLGLESADRVAVSGPIADGDLVVVGNRAQLKPGAIVTPKAMPASPAYKTEGRK
jgi:RND family efflux transporter MFP subunit